MFQQRLILPERIIDANILHCAYNQLNLLDDRDFVMVTIEISSTSPDPNVLFESCKTHWQ